MRWACGYGLTLYYVRHDMITMSREPNCSFTMSELSFKRADTRLGWSHIITGDGKVNPLYINDSSSSLWEAALKHQEDVCIRQIRVSVQALRNTAQHGVGNKLGQMLYGGNPNTVLGINTMVLKVVFLWEVNQPFHHKQRGNVSSQFWRINSLTDLSTRFVYLVRSKVDEKHFREPGNIFHLIQSGGRGTPAGGEDREIDLLSRLHDLWDSAEFDWGQEQSRTAVCRNLSQALTVTTFSHQSHRLADLNIYVNQYPHTVNVYRFQYWGIPPMTIVLDIESCKHFLCLLQFTQPKCSGWWQNCWANHKRNALTWDDVCRARAFFRASQVNTTDFMSWIYFQTGDIYGLWHLGKLHFLNHHHHHHTGRRVEGYWWFTWMMARLGRIGSSMEPINDFIYFLINIGP